ncbi:hypothetical protein ZEAMMB73_Zm00001d006812 [Zea mays]|uniref:Uncharacterized protein n=1 Tax=Zea mays TaxID=4577 RepID=A0A1D6F121_MAIZE|nr:hypothetical protein ZEAMMB73_Zm00001d006812 [Zea mays]
MLSTAACLAARHLLSLTSASKAISLSLASFPVEPLLCPTHTPTIPPNSIPGLAAFDALNMVHHSSVSRLLVIPRHKSLCKLSDVRLYMLRMLNNRLSDLLILCRLGRTQIVPYVKVVNVPKHRKQLDRGQEVKMSKFQNCKSLISSKA